jgi:nitrogen fixation protein FixH
MSKQRPLTGGHVLAALLGFFALIIVANASFLYFAIKTYPGEKEKKSYRQGLLFNDLLEARAAQDALGWSAAIDSVDRDGDVVTLIVSFKSVRNAPLEGLELAGTLSRPASDVGERQLAFTPQGDGRYAAEVPAERGAWDLTVTASSSAGEQFQFMNRVMLP